MRFIADLHIHSHYSMATSRAMSLSDIYRWAQIKGIKVIGTGDFTHPGWFRELSEGLEPEGNGLFRLKDAPPPPFSSCKTDVHFMLTSEISSIYKKNGRTRKVHSLVFVPEFTDAAKINLHLSRIGNLAADGRPILGLDAKELLRIVLDLAPNGMVVPAHAWTPHFSVFGAESGFDSLEECYEELTPYIYAIETGLSSNPAMNWRISSLDKLTLISNSDAHSPSKIGREANIFEGEILFGAIKDAIKTKMGFRATIEFFPEEGKYHYDGHRLCGVNLSPSETIKANLLCPKCGKRVTIGVMHRVERLADRDDGQRPEGALPFFSVIPLIEVIAETLKARVGGKAVEQIYYKLISQLGNEFYILLDAPLEDIERAGSLTLREAISRMREGMVKITPGFDGQYGRIRIFEEAERPTIEGQMTLF